jgi:4-amino-4-deoxy-L-arabinose transferase-like glycosyltransferase
MAEADQDDAPTVTTIRPAMLALAALFALIVLAQGISAPFQKDAEPQSAQWIQSIVRDGHWLIPRDAYGYFDRKPPLFYWLSATVADLSGRTVDEVRARAVSLAAAAALAVCVLAWTAANVGALEGWLAFAVLLGTYGFASRATEALTDMLLTLLLFAAYSLAYPLLDEPARCSPRRTILVGVILGLAVLTKGPVALVLCGLSAFIYLLIVRRSPLPLIRERWTWQLLAIAIAFGAVWYVPAMLVGKQGFLRIIFAENFGHFMPGKLGGTGESQRPFYFIGARLLGGAFPMTLLIPPALLAFATNELVREKRRAVIYQLCMPLAVLIFFSIASVKRDDYILPALPGIAILFASVFNLNGPRRAAAKLRDVIVALFVFSPIFAILFLAFFSSHASQVNLQSSDSAYYAIFKSLSWTAGPIAHLFEVWLVAVVFEIFAPRRLRALGGGLAFALSALTLCLLWTATMRPGLAELRSVKSFAPIVEDHVKGDQLCIPSGINYELSYYYGVPVPDLADPRCANGIAGKPTYLLATPRELSAMTPEYRARLKLVAQSNLVGGGGPPALYEISPGAAK